jgi:hypothetical protein
MQIKKMQIIIDNRISENTGNSAPLEKPFSSFSFPETSRALQLVQQVAVLDSNGMGGNEVERNGA